jgi:hypothetical protein
MSLKDIVKELRAKMVREPDTAARYTEWQRIDRTLADALEEIDRRIAALEALLVARFRTRTQREKEPKLP